ncbi:MAG TPA: hypothetical protein VF619_06850, partial [Allosphingosinicella sp.]
MAAIDVNDSIRLDLPDSVEVRQRPASRRSRSLVRAESDGLEIALEEAGLEVEAELELVPAAPPAGPRRRRARPADVPPTIEVRVGAAEGALLLLETEGGVFAWVEPDSERSSRRGGGRTLTFSLAGEEGGAGRRGRSGRRGVLSWIGERLVEPIRVRVLRFAATQAVDRLVDLIEGDRPFGLVDMRGAASTWLPAAPLPQLGPGPARILLMVHGTFSTTIGSYSALEATASGRAFLKESRSNYDAVLGFDHPTLGEDPERNAADLMAVLEGLPEGSQIDSVAFSRGGLVLRTLIERLAPATRPDLGFGRAVFVACTNGGTNLANPENWHTLVDLYTNIVMAGARALSVVSTGIAAGIVASTVSTLARFVKLLPQLAIEERRVPGLAAMLPDGTFVEALNSGPGSGGTDYHVIASDFEPRIEPSKGLTGELTEYLIDRLADRLFQADNDLVVHTQSMWEFGASRPPLDERKVHLIPTEETIYHIIYFGSEKVGELLTGWLFPQGVGERALPPAPPTPERHVRAAGANIDDSARGIGRGGGGFAKGFEPLGDIGDVSFDRIVFGGADFGEGAARGRRRSPAPAADQIRPAKRRRGGSPPPPP